MPNKTETQNGEPTPTVKLGQVPLVTVNQTEPRAPLVDQFAGMPMGAKVYAQLGFAGVICALLVFFAVVLVRLLDRGPEMTERMIDRIGAELEKRDNRETEWRRVQGERNDALVEKLRVEIRSFVEISSRATAEQLRMHGETTTLLRKIAESKGPNQ